MKIKIRDQYLFPLSVVITAISLALTAAWLWQSEPYKAKPDVETVSLETALEDPWVAPQGPLGITNTEEAATLDDESVRQDETTWVTPKQYDGAAFAASLAGTDIDGELRADESGHLIVSVAVKDFFDYFFNTVGEVPPEKALAEIERLARSSLPPAAADEAMALMDQYLEYKQLALDLMQEPLLPVDQQTPEYHLKVLRGSLTRLKQIRREVMNEDTVQAFFGMEEAYADYTLDKMSIQQDKELSPDKKQQLIVERRRHLPQELRTVDEQLERSAIRAQQAAALLQNAASEEDIRSGLGNLGYPAEEIDQIAKNWEARRKFDLRYAQYQVQRDQILEAGLSEEDQQRQLESLRAEYFTDERERLKARLRDRTS
ncbi:hypothetical protein BTA51_15515 [Hahella sp. CCB-MM4]|uniref:lipase secretion chaperone n=1 Tax=Hahella sp. (strain CCB-MM4) TaxID=1926491 RepID=UPI000B9A71A9|nr:lipase secretion chaperone [Hahella sp. CCB-MM4]OZG72524.1 hypothetical protein BTA51_15515 [Hahella sp. CCB-MM4]